MTLAAAGGNVNPTEISPTLQEPFIVKLKQPLRRSPTLRGEIEQIKAAARSEGLSIDRWFASPDGLLLRMQSATYFNQSTKDGILQRLNRLSSVELATTASASAGQVQPALLANAYVSDADIPEPRLRGFREFDKAAHEARIKPDAPHQKACYLSRRRKKRFLGKQARRHVWPLPPTMPDLGIASRKWSLTPKTNARN